MRRGTTLLTDLTAQRTEPSRGYVASRCMSAIPSHRKSGALGGYQSLITAISGLTVRFYWDYISSAKTPLAAAIGGCPQVRSVLPNCSPVMAGSLQTLIVYVAFVLYDTRGCGFEQYYSDAPMPGTQTEWFFVRRY